MNAARPSVNRKDGHESSGSGEDTAVTDRITMSAFDRPGFSSLHNKWQSVLSSRLLWPGEYQNAEDSCGNPHTPWGLNPTYFECCTGTPFADDTRATAFVATKLSPVSIATKLERTAPLQQTSLQVEAGEGEESDSVHLKDGSCTLFSIQRKGDNGVGGPLCTITALSSTAHAALACLAAKFEEGTCTIVPHGRVESTVQTKLGPKRLVRVVGIDEGDVDSTRLAAHYTIEDDAAVAYQPRPENDDAILADHVIARGVLAFFNGGWESNVSPTIESIMARRDYHGHDLTRCLFHAIDGWVQREWTLDIQEGARMVQATQLTNAIVDGTPMPGGGGGRGDRERGACRGLTAVTDKQLLYEYFGFMINPPAEGTVAEMMSANHRKEDEGMKLYPVTKHRFKNFRQLEEESWADCPLGWRSCDYCLATERKACKLKVCTGCLCERYFAARYCSARCQKQDRPRHKLSCGKTRNKMMADYKAFCDGNP